MPKLRTSVVRSRLLNQCHRAPELAQFSEGRQKAGCQGANRISARPRCIEAGPALTVLRADRARLGTGDRDGSLIREGALYNAEVDRGHDVVIRFAARHSMICKAGEEFHGRIQSGIRAP